jgi:spore coat polysaccharide biosynthesis protein SpsF
MVANLLAPRWIVRATGDNPLVDIEAPRRVLRAITALDVDHVVERDLPVGCAVEAVRALALVDADGHARDPYDREHVTPFIRSAAWRYRAVVIDAPPALRRPDLRLTVDTAHDLACVTRVVRQAGAAPTLPLSAFIGAADRLALREVA